MALDPIQKINFRALARSISMVENKIDGYDAILESLDSTLSVPVIGITGPPGAGKSSLVNALAAMWAERGLWVAILAVDPSSPFNFGALLGDRFRMAALYALPNVYIRSIASRGNLGGLNASMVELTDLLKNSGFDRIVIETVGVGQSEVEIAGIADVTVVVTVPESGDEVQTLKSGVMEIADIFVVNKSDRPGSDAFARYLSELTLSKHSESPVPVISTSVSHDTGIAELSDAIDEKSKEKHHSGLKYLLLAERIEKLVIAQKMKHFHLAEVAAELEEKMNYPGFNLYHYSKKFYT